MSPLRGALAFVVVVVMGCAIAGTGMGKATAEREQAPSAAQVAASRARIAAGDAEVHRGRQLFSDEGCDRCHSIAAVSADGKLGPRLDTLDDDEDDVLESIADPRDDTTDGYPEKLMPATFDDRFDDADLQALAAFVTTASGGEDEGEANEGDDGGKGRGRNRGRGRSGDG